MKGPLPNEFPFSRKRKPARQSGIQQPATQDVATPAIEETTLLSALIVPAPETASPVQVTAAEATPLSPAACEISPAVAVKTPEVTALATVGPVQPKLADSAKTMQPVRHATSRASITPIVKVRELPRAVEAPADLPSGYKGPERRRSPRQSLRAKATYRNDLNPAAAGPVQILNFSMCGVRLWSTRPMKIGERGHVKMEIGPVKWTSRVKVVTSESHDGEGFSFGCEFAANEVARRVA